MYNNQSVLVKQRELDIKGLFIFLKLVLGGFIAIVLIVFVWNSFGIVKAGQIGVRTTFGKVVGLVDPGFVLRIPFVQKVVLVDLQTQKEQVNASSASNDLQTVETVIALNYNLSSDTVIDLFTKLGSDYKVRIIDPAVQESVKAVTAQYTAEQLITKREEVTDKIRISLKDKLAVNYINVTSVSIINFDFSKTFNDAIEAKVTAEQNALTAKNTLEQKKFEAEQRIVTARAEAEAIKIQASAINSQGGADYVQLKAVEKWNGILPVYNMGQSMPIINLK